MDSSLLLPQVCFVAVLGWHLLICSAEAPSDGVSELAEKLDDLKTKGQGEIDYDIHG